MVYLDSCEESCRNIITVNQIVTLHGWLNYTYCVSYGGRVGDEDPSTRWKFLKRVPFLEDVNVSLEVLLLTHISVNDTRRLFVRCPETTDSKGFYTFEMFTLI